jgi:hypothetical protein
MSRLERSLHAFPGEPAGLLAFGGIEVRQVLEIGPEPCKHLAEAE